jgi:hypothetical protein
MQKEQKLTFVNREHYRSFGVWKSGVNCAKHILAIYIARAQSTLY